MEKLWNHIFLKELRVDSAEQPVLLTESAMNLKANREKMIEIMFETFNVPAFYVSNSASLSLYSYGRFTGIVLESGDGISQIVPMYEGFSIQRAIKRLNLAGSDLTSWMKKLIDKKDNIKNEFVRNIKEKKTYVALDYEYELEKVKSPRYLKEIKVDYKIPVLLGDTITLGKERFQCPELLFKPSMFNIESESIDRATYQSIINCDADIRKDLYSSIVLSGGNTMFDGIDNRIEKEITALAPSSMKIKVMASPERNYAAWIGGSIFASLSTFPQVVITHEEYNEAGPRIVHYKCL